MLSQLVELLLRELLRLHLYLFELFLFQGRLEFGSLGWRSVLQETLHKDTGGVGASIELRFAFSIELDLLGNEEVVRKLLGLIGLRLHVDVVEESSFEIFIIIVFFLLVIVIFVIFLVVVLVRIVKIITVVVTVVSSPASVLIVFFILSAEVLRRIVLAHGLAVATLRDLILQALLETVGHLVLPFLLVPYLRRHVAVLSSRVDRQLRVTLL